MKGKLFMKICIVFIIGDYVLLSIHLGEIRQTELFPHLTNF